MSKTNLRISYVKIINSSHACTINHFKYIEIVLSNEHSCDITFIDFINLCQRHITGYHQQRFFISRNNPCKF